MKVSVTVIAHLNGVGTAGCFIQVRRNLFAQVANLHAYLFAECVPYSCGSFQSIGIVESVFEQEESSVQACVEVCDQGTIETMTRRIT